MEKDIVSFTKSVKEELCELDYDEASSISLLSAFIRVSGTLALRNNEYRLILKTENNRIAKFIYQLIKELFNEVDVSFTFRKSMRFNKNTEYLININGGSEEILNKLSINFLDSKIPYELTDKENKIKGYLKGLFLACGSVSSPVSSNYHLEMYTSDEGLSSAVIKLLNKIKGIEFNFKVTTRRNNYVIYLKKSSQIVDYLAYLDATQSCLSFEDIRINRDYLNNENRLINMDAYNYKKSTDNARKQIEMIKELDRILGIKNIANEKVRELCYLRLENEEATYSELASLLSEKLHKDVSKSNINHLFIKIKEMSKGHLQ